MGVNNPGMKDQADYDIQRMGKAMIDLFNWTLISIFAFWLVIPLIGLAIKAFQLLKCIRDAAASSRNQSLQKFYTYYLWYWVLTVIFFTGTLFWVFSLLGSLNIDDPNFIDQFLTATDNALLTYSLSALIPAFLSILAFIAFEDFAKKNSLGNMKGTELVTGATYLKYSSILNLGSIIPLIGLFLSLTGLILEVYGLYKAGRGLQGGVALGSSFTSKPQYIKQDKTEKNQGTKICFNCGNENIQNSRFCRSCGSLLD